MLLRSLPCDSVQTEETYRFVLYYVDIAVTLKVYINLHDDCQKRNVTSLYHRRRNVITASKLHARNKILIRHSFIVLSIV